MKKNALTVASMVLGIVGSTAGPLLSSAHAAPASPSAVEVQTYGSTYGELSARWWQWVLSIPARVNPQLDPSGENCGQGQYDDVWFLAATFGGTAERSCTIPAGKPIFFPLINNLAFKPLGSETLLDLRQLAGDLIDNVDTLAATIDGVEIPNLKSYRVRSPSFTVIAPSGGLVPPGYASVPGNTDALVSDGYWLLIPPLKRGSHLLTFRAHTTGGFEVDVTYHLSIQ